MSNYFYLEMSPNEKRRKTENIRVALPENETINQKIVTKKILILFNAFHSFC